MIHRPSPEDLLRRVQADERRERRGRLKVFLGYASRVGKSYRMFGEGRRRKERGQDVVVCAVQREVPPDVREIVDRLEVMPIDVAEIIRRHPQVCLIDELAYDNPPGSRNPHRWQDVSEILDHGISVITAVNLQYIREQQDAVERITGKRSAYAVPAEFLREADEIELVDAVADSRPMAELRELALLFAADVVDRQLQDYLESHGLAIRGCAQERILVCLSPRANCEEMLRSGRRNADRFHAGLLAVYLEREGDQLAPALALARDLDADLHSLEGSSLVRSVLDFARERQITQLFISHAAEGKRALERLIDESEAFDVRLFPHREKP